MAENYQEKTEQPTEKRLEEAREKGQIAQSKELPVCFIILFSTVFLYFTVSHGFREMFKIYISFITNSGMDLNSANILDVLSFGAYRWLMIVLPFFGLLMVVVIMSGVVQTGFLWSTKALAVKLEHLNPIEGMKRFVSKRSAVDLLKALVKIALLGYIAYTLISRELPFILALPVHDIKSIVGYLGEIAFSLAMKIAIAFFFVAGLDYLYQKWQYRKDMMMSFQEVKEEMKEREGNPLVKSRIRSLQREMARRRMMEDIKTADVVVTNPTEYAVALKYVASQMAAPRVVAKGAGFVAMKIKKAAREHGVPVRENKPLAQALYFSVRIGEYVPEKFYLIVAELLAQVYKLRKRRLI